MRGGAVGQKGARGLVGEDGAAAMLGGAAGGREGSAGRAQGRQRQPGRRLWWRLPAAVSARCTGAGPHADRLAGLGLSAPRERH